VHSTGDCASWEKELSVRLQWRPATALWAHTRGGVLPFYKWLTLAKEVRGQPDGTSRYGSGYGGVGSDWAARVGAGLANGERRSAGQRVRVRRVEHNDRAVMAVRHGRFHGAQTSGR
jgi:hypothetical protein